MQPIKQSVLAAAALSLTVAWPMSAGAEIVHTTDGNGLDGEAFEVVNEAGFPPVITFDDGFDTLDVEANGRFNQGDRNEFIVLKFDLTGVDKSQITEASVNFIFNRGSSNNHKEQTIWGVSPDAAGFDTFATMTDADFDPATGDPSFDDVPGLENDGDSVTRSVLADETSFLGTFLFPFENQEEVDEFNNDEDPSNDVAEDFLDAGDTGTIDQNLLDTTGPDPLEPDAVLDNEAADAIEGTIVDYLQSLGTDDPALFLISGNGSNGQFRWVTKEAGGEAGAPFLEFTLGAQVVTGDADGDGDVDAFDLGLWQTQFGQTGEGLSADFDDDGDVDAFDLGLWQTNFGTGQDGSAVPEPATLALLLAAAGLCGRRRTAAADRRSS